MSGTRPSPRTVLTALGASAATALTLTACTAGAAAASGLDQPRPASATYSGQATDDPRVVLYALGDHMRLGACANRNPVSIGQSWSAPMVAVSAAMLNGNTGCGRQVTVSSAGTTVTATVVGRCSSCTGEDITLSPELFHRLAGFGQLVGSISVTWRYVS